MKRRKEPTEFKLGTIVVPYIEMFDEAVAIRTEGVQLIIDTYFNDLSIDDIPQQYVFTWDWLGKGYKFTVNLWKRRIKRDKCLRNACQ
ncbi:hypothetical protein [Alistipes putredinis]|uniref:hypothetical protein n=1 Tax=Alistipes putredinis TaxID=28117 RepID=UPI00399BF13B